MARDQGTGGRLIHKKNGDILIEGMSPFFVCGHIMLSDDTTNPSVRHNRARTKIPGSEDVETIETTITPHARTSY